MPAKFIKKWNTKNRNTTTTKRTTFKSPFAASFINGVKNGTPCGMIVNTISKKTGKSTTVIFKSLTKAGLCTGQKVNGQWVFWPTIKTRTNKSNATVCKVKMWQNFADWCISSGTWTTKTFNTKSASAKTFTAFFKSGFGKTVTNAASTTKTRKTRKARKTTRKRTTTTKAHRRTTGWNTGRKTWTTAWTNKRTNKNNAKRTTWNRTGSGNNTRVYQFPVYNSRTNTSWRRYARAA